MTGTGQDRFSPEKPMTRAMLVTVLWRMAGSPAAQRAQPQPGPQGSTIPGPPRPDAPFFLSGPTPPPGLPLRSRP